ncbi:acylglycerol kinase family protein [Temperatibacter marinus]|uniref:Acylglycerol kinase family protein n=1 Tax=Temperatibacter marinus TaxID=1456591 RepID=A0AA52EBS5_9PROT|nr:acylglycerol kinase family protein [Temperatibacter marinus]WND01906.1 acylglycerol kinase family protein [Temperatibacter marinus]
MSQDNGHTPLVAIISNPLSTTNQRKLPAIRRLIEQHSNIIHFELDHIESIREALELFERVGPDLIVINSGDGTVGAVLAMILHKKILSKVPPIAIMPGGKTNMTGADFNVKGAPDAVLRKILAIAKSGDMADHIVEKNVIELDMNDGSDVKVGTFFGGAGVVPAIHWCRNYAHTLKIPLPLAHAWTIINLILSAFGLSKHKGIMVSDDMTIHVFGSGHFTGKFSIMSVTTLDKLLLGLKPFNSVDKGGLKAAMIRPDGRSFLRAVIGLVTRRFGKRVMEGINTRNSDEIRIDTTNAVTLDGEIFQPTEGKPIILRGDRKMAFLRL